MKRFLPFIFLTSFYLVTAQNKPTTWNFDFEDKSTEANLPNGWIKWGKYQTETDTQQMFSGNQAVSINSANGGGNFGSLGYKIPAQYKGKKITLEGYMKIEDVKGSAGLLLRLDKDSDTKVFDNMKSQNVRGTRDWTKYSVTLEYPEDTDEIVIGGILIGTGKAWFDHFTVKIDGVEIQNVKQVVRKLSKIDSDTEFNAHSRFTLKIPNPQQTENLYLLGKVWGFVKYHHPEVAKGNHNFDYELFRILQKINAPDFKGELVKWIEKLGPFKSDEKQNIPEKNVKLLPNTQWIGDTAFCSEALSAVLTRMNTTHNSKNHYAGFYQGIKNPKFDNEKNYARMKWDDSGYRLLALFRYWNIIEYYFPNRHLMDENWDNVLKQYIPKIIEGSDDLSYKLVLLEVIGKIQDTHANIWGYDTALDNFFGERIVPVEISHIENQFVVTKIHVEFDETQNLKVGDVIRKVNGVAVEDYVKDNKKYFPASNEPTQFRGISTKILRTNGQKLTIAYMSANGMHTADFETIPLKYWEETRPASKTLEGDIGYIYPASLKDGEIKDIMKGFADKKAVILDFRCYPSDFIVFSLGKMLFPKNTEFVKFSKGSNEVPGLFEYTGKTTVAGSGSDYYKGKVVILINEQTQSSAEYHVMALRLAPKATVIGSTTAGADGNVSEIFLPGKVFTMISGIGVYYPDGTETQRIGIVPDIESKPTIKGVAEGRDEVLEKALEWATR